MRGHAKREKGGIKVSRERLVPGGEERGDGRGVFSWQSGQVVPCTVLYVGAESPLLAPLVLLEKHSLVVTSRQGKSDGGCPCAQPALEGLSSSPGVGGGSCEERGSDAGGACGTPGGQKTGAGHKPKRVCSNGGQITPPRCLQAPSNRRRPHPEGLGQPLKSPVLAVPHGMGCRESWRSQGQGPVPQHLFPWATLAPQPAAHGQTVPCGQGRAEPLPGSCALPQPIPIHQGLGFTAVLSY